MANVAPREVTNFDLATPDAEAAYKSALLTRVQKLGGRIVTSNLYRENNDQTVGTISFQVKAAEADALVAELKAIGETLRHQTTESPDVGNTTKSKRGFLVQIMAWCAVRPAKPPRCNWPRRTCQPAIASCKKPSPPPRAAAAQCPSQRTKPAKHDRYPRFWVSSPPGGVGHPRRRWRAWAM